jgi:hypothetical protein
VLHAGLARGRGTLFRLRDAKLPILSVGISRPPDELVHLLYCYRLGY